MILLELLFSKAGNLNSLKGDNKPKVKVGYNLFSSLLNKELKSSGITIANSSFSKVGKSLYRLGDSKSEKKELKVVPDSSLFSSSKTKESKLKENLSQIFPFQLGNSCIYFSPKGDNKPLNPTAKLLFLSKREFKFSDSDRRLLAVVSAKTSLDYKAGNYLKGARLKSPKRKLEGNLRSLSAGKVLKRFEFLRFKGVLKGWNLDFPVFFKVKEQKLTEVKLKGYGSLPLKEEKADNLSVGLLKEAYLGRGEFLRRGDLKTTNKGNSFLPFIFEKGEALKKPSEFRKVYFFADNGPFLEKGEKVVAKGVSKVNDLFNGKNVQRKPKTALVPVKEELNSILPSYPLVSDAIHDNLLEVRFSPSRGNLRLKGSPVLYPSSVLRERVVVKSASEKGNKAVIGKVNEKRKRKALDRSYLTSMDVKGKGILNTLLSRKEDDNSLLSSSLEVKGENIIYYFLTFLEKEKFFSNKNFKSDYSFSKLVNLPISFLGLDYLSGQNESKDRYVYSLKPDFSYLLTDFKGGSEKSLAFTLKDRDLLLRLSLRSGKVLNLSLSLLGNGHLDGGELLSEITSLIRSSGFVPGKVYLKLKNKAFSDSEKRDRLELRV